MSKRLKQILIAGAALLLLVAAMIILIVTKKNNEDIGISGEVDEDEAVELINGELSDLVSVEITNGGETYLIEQNFDNLAVGANDEDLVFEIKELSGVSVDSDSIYSTAKTAKLLMANSTIEENAQDLSKYGLDKPAAEVKVAFSNAKTYNYYVGNETPSGSQYYIMFKGESKIYAVAETYVSSFFNDKNSYIDCTLVAPVSEYPTVNELKVNRKDLSKPITVTPLSDEMRAIATSLDDPSVTSSFSDYMITSPVTATIDVSKQENFIFGLFGKSADGAVKAHPTEEDKANAGLNDPLCTVEMTVDEKTTKLIVGNEFKSDDYQNYYYVMLEGIDVLFYASENTLYWKTVQPTDFMTRMLPAPYIYNLDYIKVSYDGKDYTLNVDGNADSCIYTYEDKTLDERNFQSFCEYLYKSCISGINYDYTTDKQPDLTVEYVFDDKSISTITIGFYETDTRTVYISQNGSVDFTTTGAYYDRLKENVQRLINGETVLLTY